MNSVTVQATLLSSSEVSSILNLICPRCGGPLGGRSNEFKCQGLCRKDWHGEWQSSQPSANSNGTTRRSSRRRMAHSSL